MYIILAFFILHWQLSVFFAFAVLVTVIFVTYLIQPMYQATARIEIDPAGEVFSLEGNAAASDAEYMETQAQILQSDAFALEVIRKLSLDQNPDLIGKNKKIDETAGFIFISGSARGVRDSCSSACSR